MESHTGIRSLVVEGLHEQFDVELEFKPGLNIIYGKNGKGKTTVLHILANALEMDFKRFKFLSFRRIEISTFGGVKLEIRKTLSPDNVEVLIDGEATSLLNSSEGLSELEMASIRSAIGERSTYLPAFRSVLERVREESGLYYKDRTRDPNVDEIETKEFQALREKPGVKKGRDILEIRAFREEASITARKTVQCRQWFGPFVPTIRYPSIMEVDDGLSSEWRAAQLEMAEREQNMFADVFVKVFRTIVGLDNPQKHFDIEDALSSIAESLDSKDYQLGNRRSELISAQLLDAMQFLKNKATHETQSIEKSVLGLYVETLIERKDGRKNALQGSRDFETSINKFLGKQKTLRIGESAARERTRSSVTVGTEGGRSYGLSALSSGERQILTMLYSASRSRFKDGIFLIDEPELSLHIDWQRMILKELMALAPDRQIIACTHSPEVGADHFEETQDFEPQLVKPAQDDLFEDVDDVDGE
ncbi:ATP/GTP-binding protein [Cupriavidus necator]|uniref:ATP/GTP-binding protein n=1 Tax=Cupriavidus necator TaxID=106590 RepID=A0A1K0JM48_CUPNE|nr:ATP/GTP-binding protein [Cupriavidus necator]